MLKKILSPKTCGECRLCCGFDATDIWELPILPQETVEAVKKRNPNVPLQSVGKEHTFLPPKFHDNETIYYCPMLTERGCSMGEEKPFDCKIWPFRMMRDENGTVRITLCNYCEGLQNYTEEELQAFLLEGIGNKILQYAQQHPDHVKPMQKDYRIII